MVAEVKRAAVLTAAINKLTYNDPQEVRALFSQLIGYPVDEQFILVPPFYATGGKDMKIGRNVFINQNCTFYDLGGLEIKDQVMIGPNVGIYTSGHPVEVEFRRRYILAKPVVIEKNAWIGGSATITGGVHIGDNAIVAAGSVVTKDVPANHMVAGNPAKIIRKLA